MSYLCFYIVFGLVFWFGFDGSPIRFGCCGRAMAGICVAQLTPNQSETNYSMLSIQAQGLAKFFVFFHH
jgi:hypothetical protein